jgi:hypothetical protein
LAWLYMVVTLMLVRGDVVKLKSRVFLIMFICKEPTELVGLLVSLIGPTHQKTAQLC